MRFLLELSIGVVAAGISLALIRKYALATQYKLVTLWLVVAALIYPVVALLRGASDWVGYELIGVTLYSLVAWIGWRFSTPLLALGWALHVVWDSLSHGTFMPVWYPTVCAGFDLVLAGYILARYRNSTTTGNHHG